MTMEKRMKRLSHPSLLLSAHGLRPTVYCPLPAACCPLPSAYCPLPSAYRPLPSAYCPLPAAYCPLPAAYCLLLAAICLLPSASLAQCGPGGCCPGGQCDVAPWPFDAEQPPIRQTDAPLLRNASQRGRYASAVRIQTLDRDGRRSFGSGVAIRWGDRLVILTARHVVGAAHKIWARGRTKYQEVGVLRTDPTWDVAALVPSPRVAPDEFAPAELAWRETGHPAAGDPLESCGFGPDGRLAVNRGRFLGYRAALGDRSAADWLALSGAARAGDSGGPVFNTQGQVIGVLWGTDNHEVVATQCGRLHVFLREALGEPRGAANAQASSSNVQERRDKEQSPATNRQAAMANDRAPSSKVQASMFNVSADDREAAVEAASADTRRSQLVAVNFPNRPGFLGSGQPVLNPERPSLLPICCPRPPVSAPVPSVIVQSDPAISSIDRKMDVVIQNTTPPPAKPDAAEATPLNPLVLLAVIAACVALGFVIYFATQKT
jgi:hypothetical protein